MTRTFLCFSCPYVGCAKRGHIARHFRDNRTHRLSMVDLPSHKLTGSLALGIETATGNVFCHSCDDFIYDPTLEAIQRAKPIILGKRKRDAEQVPVVVLNGEDPQSSAQTPSGTPGQTVPPQTCKSIQTPFLEVEQTNPVLLLVAGLRGIQNLGNTCYMSSIIQSFIHNPIVRNHYLSDAHQTNLCRRQNCIHCTISTVFSSMYSSTTTSDPSTPLAPTDFIFTIFKISTAFAGVDQQDSHEFLIFLLNAMHSHHFPEGGSEERDERLCRCLAHQVFGGESQSSVRCAGCGKTNVTHEMMFDIGLQIRKKEKTTNGNGAAGGSVKGSPVSPSSSGESSDVTTTAEVSVTESLQDCLNKFISPSVSLSC